MLLSKRCATPAIFFGRYLRLEAFYRRAAAKPPPGRRTLGRAAIIVRCPVQSAAAACMLLPVAMGKKVSPLPLLCSPCRTQPQKKRSASWIVVMVAFSRLSHKLRPAAGAQISVWPFPCDFSPTVASPLHLCQPPEGHSGNGPPLPRARATPHLCASAARLPAPRAGWRRWRQAPRFALQLARAAAVGARRERLRCRRCRRQAIRRCRSPERRVLREVPRRVWRG